MTDLSPPCQRVEIFVSCVYLTLKKDKLMATSKGRAVGVARAMTRKNIDCHTALDQSWQIHWSFDAAVVLHRKRKRECWNRESPGDDDADDDDDDDDVRMAKNSSCSSISSLIGSGSATERFHSRIFGAFPRRKSPFFSLFSLLTYSAQHKNRLKPSG